MNLRISDQYFYDSAKSSLFSDLDIGRSSSTPLTFKNCSNLESVTSKFLFNNILLIIDEVVGLPLLISFNAKYSGLFSKGLVPWLRQSKEIKDLFLCFAKESLKYINKNIEPNLIRLSNINVLHLILYCEYYNCLSYERQVLHVSVLH